MRGQLIKRYFITGLLIWVPLVAAAVFLFMLLLVPFARLHTLLSNLGLLTAVVLVSYISACTGGINSPAMVWMTILAVPALLLLGHRWALWWVGLIMLIIVLQFVAVMPRSTSAEKVDLISFFGGRCHFVDNAAQVYEAARQVATETGGRYMDQFTYAERATDWRGNNNIAQSMFAQMARERHPVPRWVVVGAGTGGTSATIGRYTRYQQLQSQLCVVDPEGSAFSHYYHHQDPTIQTPGSKIEGIGRPR